MLVEKSIDRSKRTWPVTVH